MKPRSPDRYMVVFRYGSVVFLNFEEWRQRECLALVRKYATEPFAIPKSEDFGIVVRPGLDAWSKLSHEYVIVRKLDLNNILVISGVLAQTVALDHYERKVLLTSLRALTGSAQAHDPVMPCCRWTPCCRRSPR